MSLKENLRKVKELIGKQEYKEALKYCKKVVLEDKKNYSAYVFVGFANHKLSEYPSAEQGYKLATEIDPNNKDAWLGLLELYQDLNFPGEKKFDVAYRSLIPIYQNLNNLKWIDFTLKLLPLVSEKEKLVLMESVLPHKEMTFEFVLDLLNLYKNSNQMDKMKPILEKHKVALSEEWLVFYIENFSNNKQQDLVILAEKYPNAFILWKTRIFFAESEDKSIASVDVMKMIHAHPEESLSIIYLLDHLNDFHTKEHLYEQNLVASESNHGKIQYAKFAFSQGLYKKTLTILSSMTLKPSNPMMSQVLTLKIKAWIKLKQFDDALAACKDLKVSEVELLSLYSTIEYKREKYDISADYDQKILKLLESPARRVHLAWNLFKMNKKQEAAVQVTDLDSGSLSQKEIWQIARIVYQINPLASLPHFLACIKYKTMVLYYLSMIYEKKPESLARSIQCLRKAIQIDPSKEFYSIELANLYEKHGMYQEANIFYETIYLTYDWACKRLAFSTEDLNLAMICLNKHLTSIPKDALGWQGLGDVYMKQGKFLASLKAFAKSYELDGSLVYSLIKQAQVHQILGEWQEAKDLLSKSNHEENFWILSTLAGLEMEEAKHLHSLGLKNEESLQKSRQLWLNCVTLQPQLISTCKSLGDINYALKNVSEAKVWFQKCLFMNPTDSDFWYDLSLCLEQAEEKISILSRAILIQPSNAPYWNALGAWSSDVYQKQHSYIRGVQLGSDASWFYLGLEYLRHQELQLAKQCFLNAQVMNPMIPSSWIGLGLLNESIPNQHESSAAFFDHALSLVSNNVFSLLGLGYNLYLSGDFEKALHTFTKALALCTTSDFIYNMLGLCLEKIKQYDAAIRCFSRGQKREMKLNAARVLCLNREYEKSIAIYDELQVFNDYYLLNCFHLNKLDKINSSKSDSDVLSKIYYKMGQIDKAIEITPKGDLYACLLFKKNDPSCIEYTRNPLLLYEMKQYNIVLLKGIHMNPTKESLWNKLEINDPLDGKAILKQLSAFEKLMYKQAEIQYLMGNRDESLVLILKILHKDPTNIKTRRFLEHAWTKNPIEQIENLITADSVEAMNLIKQNMTKNEPVMFGLLVKTLYEKRDSKYQAILQNALKKYPNDMYLNQVYYEIAVMENRLDAALAILENVKEVDPLWYNLQSAYISYRKGDYKASHKAMQSVISKIPTSSVYFLQGKIQAALKDKTAKISFQKCLALNPQEKAANLALYKLFYAEEKWEEAENCLWYQRDILANAYIYYELSKFALESNQKDPAKVMIQKAIFLDPTKLMYWKYLKEIK